MGQSNSIRSRLTDRRRRPTAAENIQVRSRDDADRSVASAVSVERGADRSSTVIITLLPNIRRKKSSGCECCLLGRDGTALLIE